MNKRLKLNDDQTKDATKMTRAYENFLKGMARLSTTHSVVVRFSYKER